MENLSYMERNRRRDDNVAKRGGKRTFKGTSQAKVGEQVKKATELMLRTPLELAKHKKKKPKYWKFL